MNKSLTKIFILIAFFFVFTALIWLLGFSAEKEIPLYKYLVFSAQLLYGNMCYDLMKSMQGISPSDPYWRSVTRLSMQLFILFGVLLIFLYLAIKVFLLKYVGFFAAFFLYGYIFRRLLPKFTELYQDATRRAKSSI